MGEGRAPIGDPALRFGESHRDPDARPVGREGARDRGVCEVPLVGGPSGEGREALIRARNFLRRANLGDPAIARNIESLQRGRDGIHTLVSVLRPDERHHFE
jgi:hypothetical protein